MSKLWVTDSGAVEHQVKKLYVVDSGGTTRKIKKLYAVDSGGTSRLVYVSSVLETTLTVGTDGVTTYGYNSSFYGSLGSATFTDPGGTSRTIKTVLWDDGGGISQFFRLFLSGASIPNTDSTFASISVDGVEFQRSAATYTANSGGNSRWQWDVSPGLPFSGSVPLVIS